MLKKKRTVSNDCVQASLTQTEGMLMALRSMHSIGSAPFGVHHGILHPSTSTACPQALKHKLTPCELPRKLRSCANATCTPQLRTRGQNGGMIWHANVRVERQDHKGEGVLPARSEIAIVVTQH